MTKISFIIPTYNSETYIRRCLESILSYKEDDIEIVVVNDGSTDTTELIVKEYEQKDKRIKYFYKENSGVSATRNFGIERVKGEYVIFIDADDYLEPKSIEKLHELIEKNRDIDLYIMPYIVRDGTTPIFEDYDYLNHMEYFDKKSIQQLIPYFIGNVNERGERIPNIMAGVWSKIFKTEIIKMNQIKMLEEIQITEDLCFLIEYITCCNKIKFEKIYYYNYVKSNTNSITHTYIKNLYEQLEKGLNYTEFILQRKNINLDNVIMYKKFYNIYASIVNECSSSKSFFEKRKNIIQVSKFIQKGKIKGLSKKEKVIYFLTRIQVTLPFIIYYK